MQRIASFLLLWAAVAAPAAAQDLAATVDQRIRAAEPKVIEWRRHFHQNPELSNRETRTAETIAAHLGKLGMEVTTGIAHTGVIGVLKGGKPGKVVALRADMDALPVVEEGDLPFKSTVKMSTSWMSTSFETFSFSASARAAATHLGSIS